MINYQCFYKADILSTKLKRFYTILLCLRWL